MPDGSYRAIKYGFNWPSFFFGWIWCFFVARLYGWGSLWIGVILVSGVLEAAEDQLTRSDPNAALVLILFNAAAVVAFSIYFAYNANNFRRRKYIQKGYTRLREKIEASNRDQAISIARKDNNGAEEDEVGLKQTSTGEVPNVEDAQKQLEKSLENLNALKEKNVSNDAEIEKAKNRAQDIYEHQKQFNEKRVSQQELRVELKNNLADLAALHQKGVLDSSAYEAGEERLIKTFAEKGIMVEVVYKGVIIEKSGNKYVVEGREYNSIDTAKAYVDHYKN